MVLNKEVWQTELSSLITDPRELLAMLELSEDYVKPAQLAAQVFPLKVTRSFVSRMEKGNINDPLLKQVLPLGSEFDPQAGYTNDPLGEREANPLPGLLHKYQSRVLVTLTSVCGIHCRYCFRRAFPYQSNNPGRSGWPAMFDYIRRDPRINEIILSGGDPLAASDALLQQFSEQMSLLPQIKRLRLHTRLLVVLPERVTATLLRWLTSLPVKPVIVLHMNHPREMNEALKVALKALQDNHITLLNQSVLLKGVNDDADVLADLSECLFDHGVLPYYLHALDKVHGASHFEVPLTEARALHQALLQRLPGFLVPRLVMENPGAHSKTWLNNQ